MCERLSPLSGGQRKITFICEYLMHCICELMSFYGIYVMVIHIAFKLNLLQMCKCFFRILILKLCPCVSSYTSVSPGFFPQVCLNIVFVLPLVLVHFVMSSVSGPDYSVSCALAGYTPSWSVIPHVPIWYVFGFLLLVWIWNLLFLCTLFFWAF